MTPDSPSFVRFQVPAIAWAVLIFVSSSIPSANLPNLNIFGAGTDKVIHFCIYAFFAGLAYRAFRYQKKWAFISRHALLLTVTAVIVYGTSDEFHQVFVPGREPDVFDLAADTAGALVFVTFAWLKDRSPSGKSSD
jgi:VanZ family protein